jgi:hypothetical protein
MRIISFFSLFVEVQIDVSKSSNSGGRPRLVISLGGKSGISGESGESPAIKAGGSHALIPHNPLFPLFPHSPDTETPFVLLWRYLQQPAYRSWAHAMRFPSRGLAGGSAPSTPENAKGK